MGIPITRKKNNVHICGNLHGKNECEPLDMREGYCGFHCGDVKWGKYMSRLFNQMTQMHVWHY
jgi:hypothetical protein